MQGKATTVSSQQGAATAVALAVVGGEPTAYFVGHNSTLKIHTLSTNTQVNLLVYGQNFISQSMKFRSSLFLSSNFVKHSFKMPLQRGSTSYKMRGL